MAITSEAARCLHPNFSIGQARGIVKDLFRADPTTYWIDFLSSASIGLAGFVGVRAAFVLMTPSWAMAGCVAAAFAVSVCGFYRAALFTHELTHLPKAGFSAFRFAWNALIGIPFLMPSFLYHVHVHHHTRRFYGTHDDGEYLPFIAGGPREIVLYLAQSVVIPLLAIARFTLFTPLGWISPSFRRWVQRRASSMIIDPSYVRPIPTNREVWIWRVQETACLVWCLGVGALVAAGVVPWQLILQAYCVAVAVITLNAIRTLAAHRYFGGGDEMDFIEQLVDSVDHPYHPLTGELWAPVGLRFHATHHLFPSMPYHNLRHAHRRLMAQLPAASPYRQIVSPSLPVTLRQLWQRSRAAVAG